MLNWQWVLSDILGENSIKKRRSNSFQKAFERRLCFDRMVGVTGIFERISFLLQKSLFVFHDHRISFCGIYMRKPFITVRLTHGMLGALLVSTCACSGTKWTEVEKDSIRIVTQQEGAVLGYSANSGVRLLTVDGYAFKDLNRNGRLDPYEDWRLTPEERAVDLAGQYLQRKSPD